MLCFNLFFSGGRKGTGLIFGHSSGQYTDDGWPLFTEGTQSVVYAFLLSNLTTSKYHIIIAF